MSVRHLNRVGGLLAVAAALGGASVACASKEPSAASPASIAEAQTFRFAPPNGTEFVRTDRRTREVAIVGAPLRRVENEELRWKVRIESRGDEYRVNQDLAYISFARDGQTLAQGKVPQGISAELVIDKNGDLMDVRGLDRTAEILRSLAAPGKEAEAEQAITPEALRDIVSRRYRVLFGETIGRRATAGSSWTITNPPGSFVSSRTVTVQRQEPCDKAMCARLKVDFQLDPRAVADAAVEVVKSRVIAAGGDPSKVTVRSASYGMTGWMLTEPETMLSHGASLTEGGTVTVADPEQREITVQVKGTTDISYSYGAAPSAARPAAPARSRVASE
jgi:hypothetical protein